jgi:integrase
MEGVSFPGRISARATVPPMQYLLLWYHLCHGRPSPLALQDSNAVTACITVSCSHPASRPLLLHRETKTEASEATLALPGICVTALRIREKDQAAAKAAAGASWTQSGLVFTTRGGTPFEPRNLNSRFDTRCAKAGVRRITVRDMRYTCVTLLAAPDVHLRVTMRILRHAQIDVTMNVYTEVSDAKTLKALKRLGRQLGS